MSTTTQGQLGEQLGRYQLIELLGIGGMAEVFKARCTGPGGFQRTVVLKRILPAHGRDQGFVRMFVSEAKILGMLNHPNVVQVYDFGESDGTLFLVLEYVDGTSLAEAMSTLCRVGRSMPPLVAARIAHEVCRALDYVHGLQDGDGAPLHVVHRDVTPSNIMFTTMGAVKLLDFGVAKYRASQALSQQGTLKGKPAYLAPETLERGTVDRRGDLFALGVVLHELLTLDHLFEADHMAITYHRILQMPVPPPSRVRPDVPRALDAIVMKALERDPENRYQSARAMAIDLDALLAAESARADEVIAFARDLTSLRQSRPAAAAISLSQPPYSRGTTAATIRNTRALSERFRTSRVGRFLFGPQRES
ncbi:MAG TPA: serine/threonine-protein kinase [Polyangia bacterium]|nr:serine/threonine-protein kinase [Polyangia bacterium]